VWLAPSSRLSLSSNVPQELVDSLTFSTEYTPFRNVFFFFSLPFDIGVNTAIANCLPNASHLSLFAVSLFDCGLHSSALSGKDRTSFFLIGIDCVPEDEGLPRRPLSFVLPSMFCFPPAVSFGRLQLVQHLGFLVVRDAFLPFA